MRIDSAEFVSSVVEVSKCPPAQYPEFAFIGRSNVGKSSLINYVTNKRKLAKTSGTPGKTRTINHFILNQETNPIYLVDLPGYGYAKVGKTERKSFQLFIQNYLKKRENLICTFVLIDSRLEPQKIDIEFIVNLGKMQLPFVLVFTKSDKPKPAILISNTELFKTTLLKSFSRLPDIFYTSAEKRSGKEDLLAFIKKCL